MDRIELIKAEIERLKGKLIYGACASQLTMETNCKEEAYNEILFFIDSLQEEPSIPDIVDEHFRTIKQIGLTMAKWYWHHTEKELPAITSGDGTSDYVLAFPGDGCLPQVVKYSDGSYQKRGWWTTNFHYLSLGVGGRCRTQQRFPFWAVIEQPTFDKLLEQEKED